MRTRLSVGIAMAAIAISGSNPSLADEIRSTTTRMENAPTTEVHHTSVTSGNGSASVSHTQTRMGTEPRVQSQYTRVKEGHHTTKSSTTQVNSY